MHDKMFFVNLDDAFKTRFDIAKFMEFSDNYDPLTSSLFESFGSLKAKNIFRVQGEEKRFDLISYRMYSSTQYWWLTALFNERADFQNVAEGDLLKMFDLNALEDYYFSLKSKETASAQ